MTNRIANYIQAGYSGLYIISHEEVRVEATMVAVLESLNSGLPKNDPNNKQFNLFAASVTKGIVNVTESKKLAEETDPLGILDAFGEADPRSVFLCYDFHLFIEDRNPLIWRKLRDCLAEAKAHSKTFVILGCRLALPPELEKEITVLDFTLPDREQLKNILHALVKDNNLGEGCVQDEKAIADAATGLTTGEAEQAFALSVVETRHIAKDIVYREKCQTVRKNGLLEIIDSKVTLADIGGLENLKKWLLERRDAFGDAARSYGLPVPRGFLTVGQPGTGKSLTAKACRSVFGVPLLRLDAARLFGSLVGQSEQNWRTAHATAKAMAPCILWIDEADGAFSGSGSSGQTDGGTTARVIKSILQDMQDGSEGIFYVLTANDVDNLPSPLLRRMDEVWNVELPTGPEREAIWRIQIAKVGRNPDSFNLARLAASSDGYSGAEIEKVVSQALYRAFADGHREPVTEDVFAIIEDFLPLSKTMATDIERRRKRLEGVAKPANGEVKVNVAKPVRKITAIGKN
ncbi:AAA+ family ATPase [Opitutaceae bacterium TAV1]|nr:AAA+ family ATPase [Opitutaceae bacterium TAV1]